jgi:hypothetical protein
MDRFERDRLDAGTANVAWGHPIYQWKNGNGWTREPGAAVDIAGAEDFGPMVLNANHQIYAWTGGGWFRYPGAATDLAMASISNPIGSVDTVWALGTTNVAGGHPIYQWSGAQPFYFYYGYQGGWMHESGAAADTSVGADGSPMVVNSTGQIYN